MEIHAVIPVVNPALADVLLANIEANTLKPAHILIIDNSPGGYSPTVEMAGLEVLRPPEPLGVNASWNLGMTRFLMGDEGDALSVLNDDIEVGPRFFERIATAFEWNGRYGVVCPATLIESEKWAKAKRIENGTGPLSLTLAIMDRREGWAFTARRELLEKVPTIPKELKTFCGDDWIWYWTHHYDFVWVKDKRNIIFHHVGVSMRPEFLGARKNEKRILLSELKQFDEILLAEASA